MASVSTKGREAAPGSQLEPRDRLFSWLVRLRWCAIFGVALVLLLAGPLFDRLPRGSAPRLLAVLTGLAAYNLLLVRLGATRAGPWLANFTGQIAVDCLALALLVHFAGGAENPFLILFALHVVTANVVLRPGAAAILVGVAIALPAAILLAEGTGILPHYCIWPDRGACPVAAPGHFALAVFGALALALVATSYFARFLTGRLHQSERRLATTVADLTSEQRQLAETRSLIEIERSRLQAIIDCMGEAVIFWDPAGRLVLTNERARQIWPTSPQLSPGVGKVAAPPPDGRPPPEFERDGRTFEATRSIVRDARGEPLGSVMVVRDVSDRRALERHLMHEERMAVVGKMAAAVAHEINNPVGVVSLYAQHALKKLEPDSPLRGHLEAIHRNAESCRKITGDLLGLARPRPPERRPLELGELCRDVAISIMPIAARAGVELAGALDGATEPLWIEGDVDQLRQALLNLALNGIEACAKGGRVAIRCQVDPAGAFVIEVSDSGRGVPAAQIEQMFQPFFSTKPGGTGLGLAVAERIVTAHGGRIAADSEPGLGATFRIVLPGCSAVAGSAGATAVQPAAGGGS